jgi:hypothetical protein
MYRGLLDSRPPPQEGRAFAGEPFRPARLYRSVLALPLQSKVTDVGPWYV